MRLAVLIAASLLAGCATMADDAPACPIASRNWVAFVDDMPGPGASPTLIVTGEVELAHEGYSPRLTGGITDRRSPPGQRFKLSLVRDPGAPAGWRSVRGELDRSLLQYGEVIVSCGSAPVARISPVEVVV